MDKVVWEKDARYSYYKHGPLARSILGELQVQGIDYAYSLQGWLKGVNSTAVGNGNFDIGADGKIGSTNSNIARDAFGFALHYYQNDANGRFDYKPIGGASIKPFANPGISGVNPLELYNGNIAAISLNIPKLGNAILTNYKYDQLNRLTKTYTYTGLSATTNSWSKAATQDYQEEISYDANGNIKTYIRNGTGQGGSILAMDNLTYQYEKAANGQIQSNKLRYVHDQVAASNYTEDIDSQTSLSQAQVNSQRSLAQSTDNYQYDAIGNLIKDNAEGISDIHWNVYGKIASITKGSGLIEYGYDASGNRVSKSFNGKQSFYVRDASGNVMSVYEKSAGVHAGHMTLRETHMYGSSRLGIFNRDIDMELVGGTGINSTFIRGNKFFELSNHLGNVLVTISDKKPGIDDGVYNLVTGAKISSTPDGIIDYYVADIVTANDYYPGGMDMPGRQYSSTNGYRFGFNGKEKDNKDGVVQYDYGFRIYDPRLVRFKSVDPLTQSYPWNSPYSYAEGDMIRCIDLDGLEKYLVEYDQRKNGVSKIKITAVSDLEKNIQRMDIKAEPNVSDFKNDISKDVLRITNYQRFAGENPQLQENDTKLSAQELFIGKNSPVEKSKSANKQFTVDVTQQEISIAKSKTFDDSKFIQKTVYGYVAGFDVKLLASDSYIKTIDKLLNNIEEQKGSKSTDIYILISQDGKLDNDVIKGYTKIIKDKYGENVTVQFQQNSENKKASKRSKGKANANITVTATD